MLLFVGQSKVSLFVSLLLPLSFDSRVMPATPVFLGGKTVPLKPRDTIDHAAGIANFWIDI
jgi:hypothetical protein